MFGDKLIIGWSTVKISDHSRIVLPNYTGVEPKDKVIIKKALVNDQFALKLYSYSKYTEMIERYRMLRDNATSTQEIERLTTTIERLCYQLNCYLIIDNYKRLNIPKTTRESLGWNLGDQLQLQGLGESLLVRKVYQNKSHNR